MIIFKEKYKIKVVYHKNGNMFYIPMYKFVFPFHLSWHYLNYDGVLCFSPSKYTEKKAAESIIDRRKRVKRGRRTAKENNKIVKTEYIKVK